jgi:hypothetical protein
MRRDKQVLTHDEAETIALNALAFLAGDAQRLHRFLRLTGLDADDLRRQAEEPAFLAAVMDHLLADQTLLLVFAADAGVRPEALEKARAILSGIDNPGVWA